MDVLAVAIVVSVIAPAVMAWLTNRHRHQEKLEEWARDDALAAEAKRERAEDKRHRDLVAKEARRQQDAVAAQAREAARLLVGQNAERAQRDEQVAAALAQLEDVARKTHILVNSEMTAARQNELTQTRLTLTALRKVVRLDEDAGRPATDDDLAIIEATIARIDELERILADRLAQQRLVDADATDAP